MNRVLRPGGRVALSVWRSIEHQLASQIIWSTIARHLNTTVDLITRAFSLGDADELHDLLEEAGFIEVTIAPHSYTGRQPLDPRRISQIYTSLAGFLPFIAEMDEEQRTALAQMVEAEIEPAFQQYIDGDQELYPLSTHIALAYKPLALLGNEAYRAKSVQGPEKPAAKPEMHTIQLLRDGVHPSFAMLAGCQLGVFTVLRDDSLTVDQIATALQVDATRLRPLLYALVSAGLLTVEQGCFSNCLAGCPLTPGSS